MADGVKRLWIGIKYAKTSFGIGVVYFPVDNVADNYEHVQNVHDELIKNIGEIQHSYDNILLLCDLN